MPAKKAAKPAPAVKAKAAIAKPTTKPVTPPQLGALKRIPPEGLSPAAIDKRVVAALQNRGLIKGKNAYTLTTKGKQLVAGAAKLETAEASASA